MSERDPIEFLSPAIGQPQDPDPDFAAHLLDQLLDDLVEATPSDAVPLPRPAADEISEARNFGDASIQLLEPVVDKTPQVPRSQRRTRVLSSAAVVLLIVGSLLALSLGLDDDSQLEVSSSEGAPTVPADLAPNVPPAVTEALTPAAVVTATEQIAIDFVVARGAYDGAAMRSSFSDDAVVANEYGVVTVDDYLDLAEFDRLTNLEIFDIACNALQSPEQVSCTFSSRNDISRHLRLEPYRSEVLVTVSDGLIVDLLAAANGNFFELDLDVFVGWLGRTYPDDLAAVLDEQAIAPWARVRVTPASAAILAARTPEFAEATPPTAAKLLAGDPRFTTFVEAAESSRLGDAMISCTPANTWTAIAPTNAAFDHYIAESGLDRATVLGDAALLDTLAVSEEILVGTTGLGEQSVDVETPSGDAITITGGASPNVEGIPLLADVTDIATCNGVLHGIDEIYVLNE